MMNRRGFIGAIGGILGFLGFAKISNNANGGNSKNLPVVKFDDNGCCCNPEELFKDIPFSKVAPPVLGFELILPGSRSAPWNKWGERERHVWIRQEDSVCLNRDDVRSYRMWGEVNMVGRKYSERSSHVYNHFEACPQSSKTALNRCYQLPYVL